MSRTTAMIVIVSLATSIVGWSVPLAAQQHQQDVAPASQDEKTAPLLENLGRHRFPVSTSSALAQRYVNQGLVLSFGFNHAEAARSFQAAQQADPACAMAYWGEALVLGPNINAPMDPENVPRAWKAIQQGKQRADGATPRERDYIEALSARYAEQPVDDRSSLDQAYVEAMRRLAAKYPEDYDAQSLLAEALMDTTPWDYWLEGGQPKEITREILTTLERVLARQPDHPLANHLYIHAVEAAHPRWGEACADRLRDLVPGAGHLVHMPGHIYLRIGRYADATIANEKAIAADNDYVAQCHAQGLYPLAYMPHNHHFLWFSATLEGRAEQSIHAARHVAKHVDPQMMRMPGFGTLQHFYSMEMYGLLRFGRWDALSSIERPEADLKYPTGVWHYAQGMVQLRRGRLDAAEQHLGELAKLAADQELDQVTIWENNTTRQILQIGEQVLAGEIASVRGQHEQAIGHMRQAVKLEDAMRYEEPQLWYVPTRQTLGAILLQAKRPAEAEAAFREDLTKYLDNGWSLYGLQQALTAQGKADEAAEVGQQFQQAWRRADVQLTSVRF